MTDAVNTHVYQNIEIQVSNAQPGQNIAVKLQPNGTPVGWSTGPDLDNIDGISVTAQGGVLPLLTFDLSAANMQFSTETTGSGSLNFTVDAYLVAGNGIQSFYLTANSDRNVEITAAIADSEPQVVNQSKTLFLWNPV